MKILVIGGGGREHAIVWKLSQSPRVGKLYCAPGNAGIAQLAELVPIAATDITRIVDFALREKLDMVMVAPDDPLAMGLVDALEAAGVRAFGPHKDAAHLESSKAFAKDLMRRYNIPTATYNVFEDLPAALDYLAEHSLPVVIKADGLALGKGVIIARTHAEAEQAARSMMADAAFGQAGRRIVIESFMTGPELTVLAFADGRTVVPMVTSRDHKRALDGDQGLNTGGMGAIAPGADLTPEQLKYMQDTIFQPTIDAMRSEGHPFKGVIYFGLMLTPDGPRVIEYNARFGDPEAQVVLPLLENDLVDVFEAVMDEKLDQIDLQWKNQSACCVVMASGGYPGHYHTGYPVTGLHDTTHSLVFHAGTRLQGDAVVTAGGRVLGITAVADSLEEAINLAYDDITRIHFQDCHYRKDIGHPC